MKSPLPWPSSFVVPVIPQHPACPLSWRGHDDPHAMAQQPTVPTALRVPHMFAVFGRDVEL